MAARGLVLGLLAFGCRATLLLITWNGTQADWPIVWALWAGFGMFFTSSLLWTAVSSNYPVRSPMTAFAWLVNVLAFLLDGSGFEIRLFDVA